MESTKTLEKAEIEQLVLGFYSVLNINYGPSSLWLTPYCGHCLHMYIRLATCSTMHMITLLSHILPKLSHSFFLSGMTLKAVSIFNIDSSLRGYCSSLQYLYATYCIVL